MSDTKAVAAGDQDAVRSLKRRNSVLDRKQRAMSADAARLVAENATLVADNATLRTENAQYQRRLARQRMAGLLCVAVTIALMAGWANWHINAARAGVEAPIIGFVAMMSVIATLLALYEATTHNKR